MKDLLRDALEEQILMDAANGDTTVLTEILNKLDDRYIYNCLGDAEQAKFPQFKYYYEIHVVGKNGFSTSIVSPIELDEEDAIMKAYQEDKLEGDDCHFVDYVQELTFEEWDTHFNFNKPLTN